MIMKLLYVVIPTLALVSSKLVPPEGKIVFGAWLDTSSWPVSGGDSLAAFNKRIGFNTGSFQLWQNLPPTPPSNSNDLANHNADGTIRMDILNDGTTASVFLTIYPDLSASDNDVYNLAKQCNTIKSTNRDVFLRLGPEMNGEWFPYGQKPDAYKAFWIKVYTIFQTTAPHVAFVWSPNFNGPANNEPYDPYWPGADYVDWVGLSVYWKGRASEWPWLQNTEAPLNYVSQIIDAQGPEGGPISFYQTYAVQYSKPMVISEAAMGIQGGSALDVGVGREKTLMSFWNSFLFSPGFFQTYPLVKMIFAFEMYKVEDGNTQNDYRATMDLETRKAFVAGLQQLDSTGAVAWASLRNLKRDKTSSSIPLPKQALAAWSILGAIF